MADNLAQELDLLKREELYTKFTEVNSTPKPEERPANRQTKLADDKQLPPTKIDDPESSETTDEEEPKCTSLFSNFHNLPSMQRWWYYLLSLFVLKPAEVLFRQSQLSKVRQDITQQNNKLIVFDRNNKIHLVSAHLPESFNAIFKLSLEILPIINQVDHNLRFMQDVVTKLIFTDYHNNSSKNININAENFINAEELRNFVFIGDSATKGKINALMQEVCKESKALPISLYKYSAQVLKPLYQFKKICYFPFSNFFYSFRRKISQGNNIYSDVLPQDAYDSINTLYQLAGTVGQIALDDSQFREIISSYLNIVKHSNSNSSSKTTDRFLDSFSRLKTMWNTFIQKTPVETLLLFAAENPYLHLLPIRNIDNEILEELPRQIEKVYQQSVLENIERMAHRLRENRTQYLFTKYLSHAQFARSVYYSNQRTDLIPRNDDSRQGPFSHCESFAYTQNFLWHFCVENMLKPLHVLSKGVFKSDNYIYNEIVEFLGELENYKIKLDTIEKNLQPEYRTDTEIKEILIRIEQRSEGARDRYATVLLSIDREVRYLIEQVVRKLQEFSIQGIPAMENSILNNSCYQKFNSFVPQFQYMQDFNNSAPPTPSEILALWKRYIAEFCLLLSDNLEQELQSTLNQVSKVATVRSRRK